MKLLSDQTFHFILENTPLVSIDFLIQNNMNKILLGKRVNRPAQDYWFVPGGRIRKDERIEDAFVRLSENELGKIITFKEGVLHGVYQHFYDDSFIEPSVSTHYIALAYNLTVDIDIDNLPHDQHLSYKWFSKDELMNSEKVHFYTKNYF